MGRDPFVLGLVREDYLASLASLDFLDILDKLDSLDFSEVGRVGDKKRRGFAVEASSYII